MYVHVRVEPGSKRNEIKEEKNGYLSVSCKVKAERNLANECVRELVAKYYNVPVSRIKIISGKQKRKKLLSVMDKEE